MSILKILFISLLAVHVYAEAVSYQCMMGYKKAETRLAMVPKLIENGHYELCLEYSEIAYNEALEASYSCAENVKVIQLCGELMKVASKAMSSCIDLSREKYSLKNSPRGNNFKKKDIQSQGNVEAPKDIIMTKKQYEEHLEQKYKGTPTLLVGNETIYGIKEISNFKNDKTKIYIKGEEKSYVFPYEVLDQAKLYNATDELIQKLNFLIKNAQTN